MPDGKLIALITQARQWWEQLSKGGVSTLREIARTTDLDEGDVSRFLPLAFLAPDIVEAILAGRHPMELTAERLKRIRSLPNCWQEQRQVLGFLS